MKTKAFLLIEDDPEDQEFFMETMHAVSPRTGCYAVSNGEEALSVLRNERFVPDVIFTDINMPRMNGLEFLERVKSLDEFKHIPVIVYSTDCTDEHTRLVEKLGASAIYSKMKFKALPQILEKYAGQ